MSKSDTFHELGGFLTESATDGGGCSGWLFKFSVRKLYCMLLGRKAIHKNVCKCMFCHRLVHTLASTFLLLLITL